MVRPKQTMFKHNQIKIHALSHATEIIPQLQQNIKGSPIENVNEFNFLGLTLDCNLNFKPHTKIIAA